MTRTDPQPDRPDATRTDLHPDRPEAGDGGGPLDRLFRVSVRGSTVARELRGGLVTFVTMSYIVVLNR